MVIVPHLVIVPPVLAVALQPGQLKAFVGVGGGEDGRFRKHVPQHNAAEEQQQPHPNEISLEFARSRQLSFHRRDSARAIVLFFRSLSKTRRHVKKPVWL